MKHKTTISAVIIIVAVVIVGLLIWNKKPLEAPTKNTDITTTQSTAAITIQPQMVSVAEDSYLLGISGSYPQFSQADPAFNKKIADAFTGDVADFKKNANDNYQARLATGGVEFQKQFASGDDAFTYQIKTDVIQSNERFISVVIHEGGFSGGAHGYENAITYNYDVKNKKEITLDYFYPNDPNYLKTISDFARADLEPKLVKASEQSTLDDNMKSMLADGIDPKKPENFQMFTFTDDAITIYFGQYQVAPYVYGEQTVTIPRK